MVLFILPQAKGVYGMLGVKQHKKGGRKGKGGAAKRSLSRDEPIMFGQRGRGARRARAIRQAEAISTHTHTHLTPHTHAAMQVFFLKDWR